MEAVELVELEVEWDIAGIEVDFAESNGVFHKAVLESEPDPYNIVCTHQDSRIPLEY